MVNEDHPRCNVPRKTIKACPDGGSGALSLTWRAATQPHLLHRISVVRVYLHIAATTDPAGRDLHHIIPFIPVMDLSQFVPEYSTATAGLEKVKGWGFDEEGPDRGWKRIRKELYCFLNI